MGAEITAVSNNTCCGSLPYEGDTMPSGSITVTAFGGLEFTVDLSFDNEDYEIEGVSLDGVYFEWEDMQYREHTFEDHIRQQILTQLDALGWARGQEAADRADAKRKEL